MGEQLYPVRVTEIGEYIRHDSCERRFKLGFRDRELADQIPFAARLYNPIDPVLQAEGDEREDQLASELAEEGFDHTTSACYSPGESRYPSWDDFVGYVQDADVGQGVFAREVEISAERGVFSISGRIDFLIIRWVEGRPVLRVVEAKASRRDKTYHRIQVALYRMMIGQIIEEDPLTIRGYELSPDEIECLVVRIDEERGRMQSILETPHIEDLSQEETDINRLLRQGGPIDHIINSDLDDLEYKLDSKCDGCIFNVHCLPESGLHRRIELLGIEPSNIRVLIEHGVETLDDLAEIDPGGATALQIESDPSFTENIEVLCVKARARRSTLPGGDQNPDEYQVEAIPNQGYGQLPQHEMDGETLIRVFLAVDYDYVEDRIVALSAHVTSSRDQIITRAYPDENGGWTFDPVVYEVDEHDNYTPLDDRPIVHYIRSSWTGNYDFDSGREGNLIQSFFSDLVDRIAEEAGGRESAPIHFYVWSRRDITHLMEACSRVDTRLLSHLRELLGCRESLEQLIFSSLQDEVDQRYALGWTGRGLSVATSLSWYGQRYHWTRRVGGRDVWLEQIFTQDIFDFKTTLQYHDDQTWADPDEDEANTHTFELRSRFNDGLTVPYWHALWRTLPDPNDPRINPRTRGAIRRYNNARNPGYVRALLRARVHALRWIEERVQPKNRDIVKPLVPIAELPTFSLDVDTTARAAIDFLRLDYHIKKTDWITTHLIPPASRISSGETIPVDNIWLYDEADEIHADICLENYDIDLYMLSISSVFSEGSFVRMIHCEEDPTEPQRLYHLIHRGWTCIVEDIDWETGHIVLSSIPARSERRYVLPSYSWADPEEEFDYATIDESVTDFVSRRVDNHLSSIPQNHTYDWFHPEHPRIPEQEPLDDESLETYRELLEQFELPNGCNLAPSQVDGIIEGLSTRIQLLQGPPGTGKTVTTAISLLLRILARREPGDIVLVSANTHTALNNLLTRIDEYLEQFQEICRLSNCPLPSISLAKVHSSRPSEDDIFGESIRHFPSRSSRTPVRELTREGVAVIGGTTSALLKMYEELVNGSQFSRGFHADALLIDEASMLVFPHFLAISTLLAPNGEMMLTGDHRQLAPIVSHDWEDEDRPSVIVYQPYRSAYEAIRDISQNVPDAAVSMSALRLTFRLPPPLIDLIQRLYRLDDITLQGLDRETEIIDASHEGRSWESLWEGDYGLFLVLHSERESHKYNEFEAEIIEEIIEAGLPREEGSTAIVTPHRAQRSLLKRELDDYYGGPVDIIDTVERLQGGERPTVIMSATVSDRSSISSNVDFILDLNRSNVSFSRSENRLIVVCSEELINYIPADYEQYQSAMLWKALRNVCSRLIANIDVNDRRVQIFTFEPPE